MNRSHKMYCVTSDGHHNIWSVVTDVVATAVLFATGYAMLSVGFVLDAIAGAQ